MCVIREGAAVGPGAEDGSSVVILQVAIPPAVRPAGRVLRGSVDWGGGGDKHLRSCPWDCFLGGVSPSNTFGSQRWRGKGARLL